MTGPVDVGARIALLESRLAGLGSRVNGRGGGRVGSGMEAAMSAALAEPSTTTSGRSFAAASLTTSAPPVTAVQVPQASPSVPTAMVTAAGPWSQRLPAAGQRFAGDIETAAQRNGLEPELLGALVWTESAFDPAARSPAGAIGLGQLMPGTAADLGVDPHDPVENLDGAARYLRQQLDRFGDTRLALAAYNAGPGRVAAAGGVPAIEETTNYVVRVRERAATLRGTA